MNHEQRFNIELERLAWACARERFRPARDRVFVLVLKDRPHVVHRKGSRVFAQAPDSSMADVVFYDGHDAAAEAAGALAGLRAGVALQAVPVYEYAKAREYACRYVLSGARQ